MKYFKDIAGKLSIELELITAHRSQQKDSCSDVMMPVNQQQMPKIVLELTLS
jgi:hypothetical protein